MCHDVHVPGHHLCPLRGHSPCPWLSAGRYLGGVFADKTGHSVLVALALTGFVIRGYQPGDLLAGIAADLYQIADQNTFVLLTQSPVVKSVQGPLNPAVAVTPIQDNGEGWSPELWIEIQIVDQCSLSLRTS